jgi:hypothetical protein
MRDKCLVSCNEPIHLISYLVILQQYQEYILYGYAEIGLFVFLCII